MIREDESHFSLYYDNERDKYTGITIWNLYRYRNSKFTYYIENDIVYISENNEIKTRTIKYRDLQNFIDKLKKNNISIKEIENTINGKKFIVSDLMRKYNIRAVSIRYAYSRAILKNPEREIVAHELGGYSGLIIARKLNTKNSFMAVRFYMEDINNGYVKIVPMSLDKALKDLIRFRDEEKLKVELPKEIEEQIKTEILLGKI